MLRIGTRGLRPSAPGWAGCLRSVSSSSRKQLEIDSGSEADIQQTAPPPDRAPGAEPYFRFVPSESAGKPQIQSHHPAFRSIPAATSDPLQHVLDHPSASIILRDACKCSRCKDQSTNQRDFHIAHIPTDVKPSSVVQDAVGNWTIHWQNDIPGWEDHVSTFTTREVQRLRNLLQDEHQTTVQLWDKAGYARDRFTVTYNDYLSSDEALAKTLVNYARHGLVLITGIPEDEHAVENLAQRVGGIKSTFYGPTWDIKSMPNAKNVAFTNKYLGFHGDLMYMKEPPTGQFLHCIHNSCEGGESRFVDQLKAFDTLCCEDPDLADALAQTKLRYEYENDGFFYSDIKPVVQFQMDTHVFPHRRVRGAVSDRLSQVYRMYWGPQFLGSIMHHWGVDDATMKKRLRAMKKYADILERDELVFQEKMIPGTCVMFDNLRILHARNEFDMNTGKRWLRGTYVDAQEMWSTEVRLKKYMNAFQREA